MSGVHKFCYKNLLTYLCSAASTVETISIIFPYLIDFYPHIQDPIDLISMSTTYLESTGSDLSENKLFQCVSILFMETSTVVFLFFSKPRCHIADSSMGNRQQMKISSFIVLVYIMFKTNYI